MSDALPVTPDEIAEQSIVAAAAIYRCGGLRSGRSPHQRFSHADQRAVPHIVTKGKAVRREYDDGRSVLKPSEFLALADGDVAGERSWSAVAGAENQVEKMQADARHQDRGDRH